MFDPSSHKVCSRCSLSKPLEAFIKQSTGRNGLIAHCRACESARKKAYAQTPTGKEKIKSYQRTAEQKQRHREYIKTYAASHREVFNIHARKYRAKFPERTRARQSLAKAVKSGKISRPDACSECGSSGFIEAHHHLGYAWENRFNVVWLCKKCHWLTHAVAVGA